ncbi:hypothetical protein TWF225_009796 [Orbilia oligospora]|uniref:Uncharacterized protein n=1 Tax=Orbilia oligospora TaxID=2813651 RepID=A0A7C8PL74_ORBOL|nr:hypothetical protein TWF751_006635 [Orbilia oligospora]KAF3173520.1 hypothetical protein TWF225_009796 [Orbilia oligospora]KAF3246719.1 hypothetical protein TWF128_008837 [Orbilia oligospora]KAF3246720.1 hypothetical protein TWF128_008837 [Orbilia oligospora]KAF3257841.1 hypothetical protein TWF217_005945 [Orbilia oligospora]
MSTATETPITKKRKRQIEKDASIHKDKGSSNPASPDPLSWPPHFQKLSATHKALNLVYTFCCTRKHLATTFENLKSAVEDHIKRPLSVDDIAQIKFLVPDAVNFEYVDEEALQLQVFEGNKAVNNKERDVYLPPEEKGKKVLLFEYTDGDFRQNPKAKSNQQGRRRKGGDRTRLPEPPQPEVLRVIAKRTSRFELAVDKFIKDCSEKSLDPVEQIKLRQRVHVPSNSHEENRSPPQSLSNTLTDTSKDRPSVPEIIEEITTRSEFYRNQIVPNGHLIFPAQDPRFGNLEFPLSQVLVDALYNVKNITRLYSHQATALNDIFHGENVVVSTSTSSGKSIIYQIPFLHRLQDDPDCRALLVFPTKALAQDQKTSLAKMLEFMKDEVGDVLVDTYDGDTPKDQRRRIREEARVVFTNPDMLHLNILPNEEQWRIFLRNLKFVVIDELHVYNGLFGSHVSLVMRRLRRICSAVGNNSVIFIACSATVENPEKHMKDLLGISSVKLTSIDGSPTGEKTFLCWNCPYKDPTDLQAGRVDPVQEAANLFVELIVRGVRTIAFCRVRRVCELTVSAIKQVLIDRGLPQFSGRVMSYRGGYSAQDRRNIESEMFNGHLLGVVATTALELGIDVGTLDAVLMVGFPYSISNLRQQSGRAGRRKQDSLSVLIGDRFALDQHYMSNPDLIKTAPNPSLHIDLENILILEGHVQCAAFEMPINPEQDAKYFGTSLKAVADERLVKDNRGFYHCHDRFRPYPSQHVSIRDTEDDHFAVVDVTQNRNVVLETVEPSRAPFTIYEGAIFLHQGLKYLVREFNVDRKIAKVELVKVDWITQQRDFTDVDPVETEATRQIPGSNCKAYFGDVKITSVVFGYFKVDRKGRKFDAVDVETPPLEILSKGMWLDVPQLAFEILRAKNYNIAASIHAAEHSILALLPTFVISSAGDVRTECKAPQKEFAKRETTRKRPGRLTFYDAKGCGSTGSGITGKAFEFVEKLLKMAVGRIEACQCTSGCPGCVASENCKEANAVISKIGAMIVMKTLLGDEIDLDALPEAVDESAPVGVETVVLAEEVRFRAT